MRQQIETFPNCEECPAGCPLGHWNGGTCGAKHLNAYGDQCEGTYQFVSISPDRNSYDFKCDKCGDILTESISHYDEMAK